MSMMEPEALATSLKNSWKFLESERLPRIDSKTTFEQVYSQLNRSNCSGFLLSVLGEVRGYVKADELAQKVVNQAHGDSQVLRTYSNAPIGELLIDFATPLIPVRTVSTAAIEAALDETKEDMVFRVTEDEGTVGWYLNHNTVREAATKKTVFLCANGHRNPDADHGTCYHCPFPIVATAAE